MNSKFANVAMLALALGISAPATVVWAESFNKIEGIVGESAALPLSRLPGDAFTPMQLRNFEANRVQTLGDLMRADATLVGRILKIDARRARMVQNHIREATAKR